jgi:hypothetical protein
MQFEQSEKAHLNALKTGGFQRHPLSTHRHLPPFPPGMDHNVAGERRTPLVTPDRHPVRLCQSGFLRPKSAHK